MATETIIARSNDVHHRGERVKIMNGIGRRRGGHLDTTYAEQSDLRHTEGVKIGELKHRHQGKKRQKYKLGSLTPLGGSNPESLQQPLSALRRRLLNSSDEDTNGTQTCLLTPSVLWISLFLKPYKRGAQKFKPRRVVWPSSKVNMACEKAQAPLATASDEPPLHSPTRTDQREPPGRPQSLRGQDNIESRLGQPSHSFSNRLVRFPSQLGIWFAVTVTVNLIISAPTHRFMPSSRTAVLSQQSIHSNQNLVTSSSTNNYITKNHATSTHTNSTHTTSTKSTDTQSTSTHSTSTHTTNTHTTSTQSTCTHTYSTENNSRRSINVKTRWRTSKICQSMSTATLWAG